eukprot:TRINITY_DN4821_c0_g1_i1.p1 TRINITY_DN4821_c0_g1~~TRINITY_DN4821_c0_g1_i1.p1  ORF type:complete len:595 (+),score=94.20 TRINITY_DN4821_c0_g1_i1:24-1808(+)
MWVIQIEQESPASWFNLGENQYFFLQQKIVDVTRKNERKKRTSFNLTNLKRQSSDVHLIGKNKSSKRAAFFERGSETEQTPHFYRILSRLTHEGQNLVVATAENVNSIFTYWSWLEKFFLEDLQKHENVLRAEFSHQFSKVLQQIEALESKRHLSKLQQALGMANSFQEMEIKIQKLKQELLELTQQNEQNHVQGMVQHVIFKFASLTKVSLVEDSQLKGGNHQQIQARFYHLFDLYHEALIAFYQLATFINSERQEEEVSSEFPQGRIYISENFICISRTGSHKIILPIIQISSLKREGEMISISSESGECSFSVLGDLAEEVFTLIQELHGLITDQLWRDAQVLKARKPIIDEECIEMRQLVRSASIKTNKAFLISSLGIMNEKIPIKELLLLNRKNSSFRQLFRIPRDEVLLESSLSFEIPTTLLNMGQEIPGFIFCSHHFICFSNTKDANSKIKMVLPIIEIQTLSMEYDSLQEEYMLKISTPHKSVFFVFPGVLGAESSLNLCAALTELLPRNESKSFRKSSLDDLQTKRSKQLFFDNFLRKSPCQVEHLETLWSAYFCMNGMGVDMLIEPKLVNLVRTHGVANDFRGW